MKFTCESCGAQYMISDEKVGPSGVKVRCKKCGNVILVRRGAPAPAEAKPEAPGVTNGEAAAAEPKGEAAPGRSNGQAAPTPGAPSGAAPGLDAELGQAFDHAFGDTPPSTQAPAPAAGADTAATQLMSSEDAAKVFSEKSATSTASDWYVAIGQAQVGPLPLTEVKKKWEAGDVGPDSLVWRPGMSDWAALSTVQELAGYLAPVPRASPQPARAAEPRMELAGRVEAPTPAPAEPTWRPAGASALAALANEEIAARAAPEPKPAARPVQGAKSLVDALPDGGGVDPTGALPLNIKALEAVTGEKQLERRSSLARGAEAARHRRSTTRAVVVGVTIGAVLVAGAAVGGMPLYRKMTAPPPAPAVAVKPPPPVNVPLPPPPVPAAKPAGEVAAPPAVAATSTPAQPPAPPAEPTVAKDSPATKPERHAANGTRHAKTTRAEPPARKETRREPPRIASTEQPAQTAPARKKGGGLLDFESNDKALDEALGGSSGSAGRSVYVPPAPTGGGALPAKVSPGEINAAVAARIDSLRRCVSEQKAREPDASGTLKMRWVIQGDGSVRDVKCLTSEYAKGAFAQCIEGVVKGIKFPRSTTSGQEVTFPFNF